MDLFFQQETPFEMLWPEIPEIQTTEPAVKFSAFSPYSRPPSNEFSMENAISLSNHPHQNLNKRMIEILKAIPSQTFANREPVTNYRHMINERQRRNKLRQKYMDLHSLLPPKTKPDKNSIVLTAASQLHELEDLKAELQNQNDEIEARLARRAEKAEVAKINLRVIHPSSAMNSLVEVLKCLKSMEMKAKTIGSVFSGQEFSATLEIESKMKTAEVKKAIENAVRKVERKFVVNFVEARDNEVVENFKSWEGQVAQDNWLASLFHVLS